jgi:murein DD-endopeptidase MepM/ murein hydrolase activator NlpD
VVVTIRGRRGARRVTFARVPVGRTVRLALPRGLAVGRHRVRLRVYGLDGDRAARSRAVTLTVVPKPKPKRKRKPRPKPERPRPPASTPSLPTVPVPPSLGGPATIPGVFPVRGAYSLGGDGARFGAGRDDHSHEGQDILAASGVPVIAPLAGTLLFNSYQANGAGRYVILRADNGWDMMFAHCLAGSATLDPGARVAAGGQLCSVGATGSASGPHLHFEIWPNGWRHLKGTRPVDPLPQLRRWAGG